MIHLHWQIIPLAAKDLPGGQEHITLVLSGVSLHRSLQELELHKSTSDTNNTISI